MIEYFERRGYDVRRHAWMFCAGFAIGTLFCMVTPLVAYAIMRAVMLVGGGG